MNKPNRTALTCAKCPRYSYPLRRCLDGKVNPPTLKGTLSVASLMGLSAICPHSKWKTKALKQMATGRKGAS